MDSKKGLTILAVVLGLLLLLSLIFNFRQKGTANALTSENTEISEAMETMTQLRDDLARQVDSLSQAYQSLAYENESLQGSLTNAQGQLTAAESALAKAKRASAAELNDLRAQIQELMSVRSNLEGSIMALQAENDSLRYRTGVLETDLAMSQEENAALANLNQTIQQEVGRLTLANFKASAFQVDIQQRSGEKVTSRSRRARRIVVSFDLANVPRQYQGVRPVYLVISDANGNPLATENPVKATIDLNGQPTEIIAVQGKDVNVGDSQRLSFTHDLADRLAAGFYRASVYTDIGLLGASSFQLR